MSASLVGSEMCIRDSLSRDKSSHLQKLAETAATAALHLDFATVYQVQRPVSYTHLTLPTICSV
eukprot:15128004-Alexandrium_andersonii.AAC.1